MKNRLLCILLCIAMTLPLVSVAAADNGIIYSEGFSAYAENSRSYGKITYISGVDTRVITDEGSKVLFGKAWGEPVKHRIPLSASSEDGAQTVFSARVKLTGGAATGSIFAVKSGNNEYTFLSYNEKNQLRLADGKIVGGIPRDRYVTVTIIADWSKKLFDVYLDKKCVAGKWVMSTNITKLPTQADITITNIDDTQTGVYIDDIRVYSGAVLPWKMSFPKEAVSTEVLEFTETESVEVAFEVIADLEFNGRISGVTPLAESPSRIFHEVGDDGTEYLRAVSQPGYSSNPHFDILGTTINTANKFVTDFRFKINELSGASFGALDGKNPQGAWLRGFEFKPGGAITYFKTGETVGSYKPGKWVRFTTVANMFEGKIDVYIDGEYSATVATTAGDNFTFYRFDFYCPAGGKHDSQIDWVRIYTGTELLGDEFFVQDEESTGTTAAVPTNTIMDPADKLKNALRGKTMFMINTDAMYINGEKSRYPADIARPAVIDGVYMISDDIYTLISGKPVSFSEATGTVTAGDATMKLGATSFTAGGSQKTLDAAPVYRDGVVYLPVAGVAQQLLGKVASIDNRGLIIIGDEVVATDEYHFLDRYIQWRDADLLWRYMQFDNPGGDAMLAAIKEHFPDNAHPRIVFTREDAEYILEGIKTDTEFKRTYDDVISTAGYICTTDYSKNYNVDDPSNARQDKARLLQNAMERLAQAYILTGDTKYAVKAEEMLRGLISWPDIDWNVSNLTVGHWAAAVAYGYDAFYNYFASTAMGRELLKAVRDKAYEITMIPHIDGFGGAKEPHYLTMQDNFIGISAGGMMTLLCVMGDDLEAEHKAEVEFLLDNIHRTLQIFATLSIDGGYYESIDYTDYLQNGLRPAVNAMFNCFGTDYGLGSGTGFELMPYQFIYMGTPDFTFNYHDGSSIKFNNPAMSEVFAYRYNDPLMAELAHNMKVLSGSKSQIDIEEYFYYKKATENTDIDISSADLDRYFTGSSAGGFKSSHTVANPTFAGFHAGWTGIPHDFLDIGTFAFEADNVVWATVMGSDNYSLKDYFSMKEYVYYRKRPEGSNTLMINPQVDVDTYYGQKIRSVSELIASDMNKPKGAYAVIDMSETYERDVTKAIRGYYFGDDRNTYTIQDELTLRDKSEVYWFMHTEQQIDILSDTKARLTGPDGKTCIVDVYCSAPGYTLKQMTADPLPTSPDPYPEQQKSRASFRKLVIHAPEAPAGDMTISVKLSPETGTYNYTEPKVTPIAQWTVPDGERTPIPVLTELYADGSKIDIPVGTKQITAILPFGTTQVPTLSAKADMGNVSVAQASGLDDVALITVSGDNIVARTFEVRFHVTSDREINVTDALVDADKTEVGRKGTLITPVKAATQGDVVEIAGQSPDKMLDNDPATYAFRSGTDGVWYEFDLGEVKDIKGISARFYLGERRYNIFDILYSEDGINFKRVFNGTSTGTGNDWESVEIPGRARYIRMRCYGTSTGTANSIIEFRAYN